MSDNTVKLMSNSESETSYASRMGKSLDSHLYPLDHDRLEPKAIPLSDNSDLERVFEDSLEEGGSSSNSLETLLSNVNREINHIEISMPPHILPEEEI